MSTNELCLNDGTPLDEYEPGLFVCPSCGVAFPIAYIIARRESCYGVPLDDVPDVAP